MDFKMKQLMLIFCVIPTLVTSITISPNGNSPEIKMIGGMMVDVQKGFTPMASNKKESIIDINNYQESRKIVNNATKLSINERYRRLIPYMTFYYANDLATPTTEAYSAKNVEVEKAEIIEATTIGQPNDRQLKKIYYPSHRNIPRYQGNRLTQYNIASANPTKLLYKEVVPVYQSQVKITPNYNPLISDGGFGANHEYEYEKVPQKPIIKAPSSPFVAPTRNSFVNLYNNDDSANIHYYLSEKEHVPKFKLVPYQQSPPVAVPQNDQYYELKKPVRVFIPKDQVYIKPRPLRPQLYYDDANIQQLTPRKPPGTVSENYYEKRRPRPVIIQRVVESGFKPIANPTVFTTEAPIYSTPLPEKTIYYESPNQLSTPAPQSYDGPPTAPKLVFKPNYYQYVVEQPTAKPEPEQVTYQPQVEQSTYNPAQHSVTNTITLSELINSLQLNKSIPNPITKENVGSSIKILLQVLNGLKAAQHHNDVESPVLSTPAPFVTPEVLVEVTSKPLTEATPAPNAEEVELHEEPYLAPVKTPSQHLDEIPTRGTTSQRFPLPIVSDDDGGTPGRPGADYPILTTIPTTSFNCKTQRYKGFFADPETRCQVWHYCDLNGGQASFLCPNGTIFSQAGLTCDWWFNVRCSSTAQLYVLNESLYKYILPHSPKFPEDYSGPLVDKYLTLKFKEMEEQFKKNKNKKTASDKMDEGDSEESSEDSSETAQSTSAPELSEGTKTSDISEASVIVDSPGNSGNVERLSE